MAGTTSGMPAPIRPDKWAPPGEQPGSFYVGISAHERIARRYVDSHPGDVVFTNHTAISSILKGFGRGAVATGGDENLKPDIVNVPRKHLYEIKPAHAAAAGAAKAATYLAVFRAAGVPMQLGPVGERGTFGMLPAPAGVFEFSALAPGVIGYQYHARQEAVPIAEPAADTAAARRWAWKLTPAQRDAMTAATVGGAILTMLAILAAAVTA